MFMRLEACQRETADVLGDLVKDSETTARAAQKVTRHAFFPLSGPRHSYKLHISEKN
jgi:hypothetical protein